MGLADKVVELAMIVLISAGITYGITEFPRKEDLHTAYLTAMRQYADTNNDMVVTPEEELALIKGAVDGRAWIYPSWKNGNGADGWNNAIRDVDGRTVSMENFTEWLKGYRP